MMRNPYKYILLFTLCLISSFAIKAHPIKITTGKLVVDSDSKSCELTLNFFADDFESTLQKEFPQLPFNYNDPSDEMKSTIDNYVVSQVSVSIDEVVVVFTLKTIALIEDNVCQVTFTGNLAAIDQFETLTIKNTLLFDAFDKQSNILHLYFNGDKVEILQFYPTIPVRKQSLE
ncbi:DUF6702 family protein [Carboxylicivirga linearis]|uniref:GerMN domain-containing protein n=1 Tax=Carboxylicivirga linearis TaxID=1628157 RepID=A0ABS5JZK2_9BACT|nr:DUF6702 family protein [Carboxylicivirga linearis]MBS2100337.1 hypothetical protein [Carboxylicivirga linearis]